VENLIKIYKNIIIKMILLIGILSIMIIIILCIIYFYYPKIEYPIYCISLPSEYKRRNSIKKYFKNIIFFDAIDTRNELWKFYQNQLTNQAILQLEWTIKYKIRKYHYDLLPGAVGCFLSHIELYKLLSKKNENIFLILEDDSKPNINFSSQLNKILKNIPHNMDFYFLNYQIIGNLKYISKYNCYILPSYSNLYLMNCYLISKKGINKILDFFEKIEWQIDSWLSKLNSKGLLNIYCSKEILCPQSYQFNTSIQIYSVI
jgi:GR25 family glycosyltransferase involved in LPS biosynthesis